MTYLIDAWLDRPEPYLRILDRDTGAVCATLGTEDVTQLMEQGTLDLQMLNSTEPGMLKELIRNLFLAAYAKSLRPE